MKHFKFDFLEKPQKEINSSDVLLPHLSALDKKTLNILRGGVDECDAVCLPPGYDHCNCYSNLCITDPMTVR